MSCHLFLCPLLQNIIKFHIIEFDTNSKLGAKYVIVLHLDPVNLCKTFGNRLLKFFVDLEERLELFHIQH